LKAAPEAVDRPPTAPKLALEDARTTLFDLGSASRQLALAKFTTLRGGVALLRYLAAALLAPGAPRLPIETAFDMQWEVAFGQTCKAVADSLTALEPELAEARAEIERLQDAKRRALQLADERAKEAVELRIAELEARL
jgi:hypothetical protein